MHVRGSGRWRTEAIRHVQTTVEQHEESVERNHLKPSWFVEIVTSLTALGEDCPNAEDVGGDCENRLVSDAWQNEHVEDDDEWYCRECILPTLNPPLER